MANQLIEKRKEKRGEIVTEDMLHDLAYRSNQYEWVKSSGQLYFVNKMVNSKGETVHFLDRATPKGTN